MVTGLWLPYVLNFFSLSQFWRYKEKICPLSPGFGLWRALEVPDCGLACWFWFEYDHWSLINSKFCSLYWFWRCKEHLCPLSPYLGLQRILEVPEWCLTYGSWFWYCQWSFIYPWSPFWLSVIIWRCKVHWCSLSPDLGLWRKLEVPDLGLASWYWFEYCYRSCYTHVLNFGSLSW